MNLIIYHKLKVLEKLFNGSIIVILGRMMKREQSKLLILSSLGGILEFYDFIIFALFASYISNAFFPASNDFMFINYLCDFCNRPFS